MHENEWNITTPLAKKYLIPEMLPKGFDIKAEEARLALSEKDKAEYFTAIEHIYNGKYNVAQDKLKKLRIRYENTTFEKSIMLRLSDCLMLGQNAHEASIEAESMLAEIINSNEYSSVLLKAFERWRSLYQDKNYGPSNQSNIPNDWYNRKRWGLVKVIKEYIKQHPDDVWAKEQSNALLNSPNINRGATFGNYNLLYYAWFYSPDTYPYEEKDKFYKLSLISFNGDI